MSKKYQHDQYRDDATTIRVLRPDMKLFLAAHSEYVAFQGYVARGKFVGHMSEVFLQELASYRERREAALKPVIKPGILKCLND